LVSAVTSKKPKMTVAIGPRASARAGAGAVGAVGDALGSVDSWLLFKIASAHPSPFKGGGIKAPEIIQSSCRLAAIISLATEEPELSAVV
jgi:hypothetical protein